MLLPKILLSVLSFTACVYGNAVKAQEYAKETLAKIENKFIINNEKPPYVDTEKEWKGCFSPCWNAGYYTRSSIKGGTPTAYYTSKVQLRTFNTNDETAETMKLDVSTAIMEARTEGWTIGGKISYEFLELSADNLGGNGVTTTEVNTTTVGTTHSCPPLHSCRIETWTFHIKIDGTCTFPKPMIDCANQIDMCATDLRDLPCSTHSDSIWRDQCRSAPYGYYTINKNVEQACQASTPVHEESGEPYTVIVAITSPLGDDMAKRSDDQPDDQLKPDEWLEVIG